MLVARIALASILALSFPSNTPWDKPANQWSAADTNKILEDSPWAPGKVTVETRYTQKYSDNLTHVVSDSAINSQSSSTVQSVQISRGGTSRLLREMDVGKNDATGARKNAPHANQCRGHTTAAES